MFALIKDERDVHPVRDIMMAKAARIVRTTLQSFLLLRGIFI